MSNTATYSAAYAKVKALSRGLLTEHDYAQLLSRKRVPDICSYLKNNTSYNDALKDIKDTSVHRGDLEGALKGANKDVYKKLASFLQGSAKTFMNVYVVQFEIEAIKCVLRNINSSGIINEEAAIPAYFDRLVRFDAELLQSSTTLLDALKRLSSTPYYDLLFPFITSKNDVNMFELEITLDIYFYKYMYKMVRKHLSGEDFTLVMHTFGVHMDLLNMLWIYRCKNYYNVGNGIIDQYIIPIHYKLKKRDIAAFSEANSPAQLNMLYQQTHYADVFKKQAAAFHEQNVSQYLYDIYLRQYKHKPFTLAEVISYIHIKECEINNLIKIIEGARYSLDMNEINKFLIR